MYTIDQCKIIENILDDIKNNLKPSIYIRDKGCGSFPYEKLMVCIDYYLNERLAFRNVFDIYSSELKNNKFVNRYFTSKPIEDDEVFSINLGGSKNISTILTIPDKNAGYFLLGTFNSDKFINIVKDCVLNELNGEEFKMSLEELKQEIIEYKDNILSNFNI